MKQLADVYKSQRKAIHESYPDVQPVDEQEDKIQVSGLGTYTKETLKKDVVKKLQDLSLRAAQDDFEEVYRILHYKIEPLLAMVKALVDAS